MEEIPAGKGERLACGTGVAIVAIGPYACRALEAARQLAGEGKSVTVWDVRYLKPFDPAIMEDILSGAYHSVITVEDGAVKGGLFSEISEAVAASGLSLKVYPLGIPDRFIHHGPQSWQRSECGLDKDKIFQKVLEIWK